MKRTILGIAGLAIASGVFALITACSKSSSSSAAAPATCPAVTGATSISVGAGSVLDVKTGGTTCTTGACLTITGGNFVASSQLIGLLADGAVCGLGGVTLTAAQVASTPGTSLLATAGSGYVGALSDGSIVRFFVVSANATAGTATIQYQYPSYTLLNVTPAGTSGTVNSSPAGIANCSATGGTCLAPFLPGTVVTLTETPGSGQTFSGTGDGWGNSCAGTSSSCKLTMSAGASNVTGVTATWGPSSTGVTLTVTAAGSGTVVSVPAGINCGATCSATFAPGATVTLTATAASGSTFSGWSGGCSGTSTCVVTMSAAQSVTATFATTAGVSQAAAVSTVMNLVSSAAGLEHARGNVQPRTSVPVSCPSGGSISVNTAGISISGSNPINVGGSIVATFSNCVADGYTFTGGWTENFSFTATFSPNVTSPTSVSESGTVSVTNGNIGVNGSACSVNITDTLNDSFNLTTDAISGTVSYSGSACGQSGSGTITF